MAESTMGIAEMPQPTPNVDGKVGGVEIKRRGNEIIIDFAPGMRSTRKGADDNFSRNIVDELEIHEETKIANDLYEQVQADLDSRRDWQLRVDQAMELLGLRNTPLEDLPFEGAASVTYPIIAEACVQFQARSIEEVFPSDGPVKVKIIGERTEDKVEQAERVKNHMNWQMTEQDQSYFWHTDQMLFWLPLSGSAFKKSYYDHILDMNVGRLVYPGDLIVPYTANDLRTATRYTHRMRYSEQDLRRLIASGFYRQIELVQPSNTSSDTEDMDRQRELRDEADDRQQSMHPEDFEYELYEMHCDLVLPRDQRRFLSKEQRDLEVPLPYIVTLETASRRILSIRRNWEEDDELHQKLLWFTHYKYLPGMGFYGFGLLHLIGSLAESSTGTLRALLDAAAFANMQGGFVSSDARLQPGDEHIAPGVWKQVDMTADELNKSFYTPPFKEPSPALARLFEILTDAARRFASITEEMTGDAPNTGPVGTTLALIEQGSKVFSGVHRRLHTAQAEEFRLRARLNYLFLDEEYSYDVEGEEHEIFAEDYDGRIDVTPVSDPNIFSSVQRIAQAQALIQVAAENPDLYDRRKVHERFLKAIKIPDWEEVLSGGAEDLYRMDPISENMKMMVGTPVKAFLEQDHPSHIQLHENFLAGLNQQGLEVVQLPMMAHMREHYAYLYWVQMNNALLEATGQELPPPTFMDQDDEEIDEESMAMADQALAAIVAQLPPIQLMPPDQEGGEGEAEFQAEEQRKQEAWEADENRKDESFFRDQDRKDLEAERTADRDMTKLLADESRSEEAHQNRLTREEQIDQLKARREKRLQKDRK